jgi:magnesium transporter
VDAVEILVGVVSLRALVGAPPDIDVSLLCDPDVVRISVHTDQELVAQTMAKYDLLAVPVVDDDAHLVGMITIDDAVDVLTEEALEDLLRVSGSFEDTTSRQPRFFGPVFYRLPWLLVTVIGELAVALLMNEFIEEIQRLIVLALFIPIVTATAGSVGVQSLAAALGSLQESRAPTHPARTVFREACYGLMLGLASGVIAGFLAFVWWWDPWLGLHIGFSMTLSLALAAALGSAVPLVLGRLRIDPTIALGPLITTVNDALSLVIYLGLAGLLLVS